MDIQITLSVTADQWRDFHPLADHMAKFSAFPFSLQLMFDQTLTNLIVYLMISQNLHTKGVQMI